jgi:hypothetical protein
MQKITHEEIIKRAEYIGQVAEAELFEADRRGGYSTQLKDAIHETQLQHPIPVDPMVPYWKLSGFRDASCLGTLKSRRW